MKTISIILLLIFSTFLLGQINVTTKKGKISFKKEKVEIQKPVDKTPPTISTISPSIKLTDTLFIQDDFNIKLKVNDESGIKSFTIDQQVVDSKEKDIYESVIGKNNLKDGLNKLSIAATDSNNNSSFITLNVMYNPDRVGPVVSVIEPVVQDNVQYISKTSSLWIKVKVADNSEVLKVSINNTTFNRHSDDTYSYLAELQNGINLISIIAEDNKGNISKHEFSVKYQPDIFAPVITILEPTIPLSNEITVSERTLAIRVSAKDNESLGDVMINNLKADSLSKDEFYTNLNLHDGKNLITIKAVDKNSNVTEKTFFITKVSDVAGPIIKIIEPYAARGIDLIHKSEVIKVRGVAIDESGVKEVYVNNRKTMLNPDGEFNIDVYLRIGLNNVIVRAIDNKLNISIDTFIVTRKVEELIAKGKYYALIIGVDKYKGVWPELRNAVNDAKAIEKVLKDEYNFEEIHTLYNDNATRKNIIEKFELFSNNISKDDNVLVFYSGHGEFKQQLNKGYWVPIDALTKSTADYISNSDIQTFLNGIPSKHTLLVSDACFSGDIFRGRTEGTPFEDSDKYFREVYRKVSRAALTSGGIEPVTDGGREGHSVFTYYLLKTLKENSAKYFTAGQLFSQINIPIINNSEQTPIYMPIKNTGDEGGQFVFIRK